MEENGNHEQDEDVDKKRKSRYIQLPGDTDLPPTGIGDEDLSHMTNWLECLRSRKQPNATVQNGFSPFRRLHHGSARVLDGQETLFRFEDGTDSRSFACGVGAEARPLKTTLVNALVVLHG